jgi:hypothetical protein
MIDNTKFKGTVQIKHWNSDGELLRDATYDNLVVTTGLEWIAGRLSNSPPTYMNYIAVGTSNTAPSAGQTTLVAEIARQVVTVTGGSASGATIIYSTSYGAGVGTGALQEAGIFQSSSGSTMLSRVTFAVINKAAGDTVSVVWTIAAQ